MTHELVGNWKEGIAFDLHTVGSKYLGVDEFGHNRFDNTRSDMGELVYQLKYHGDQLAVPKIINLLKAIGGIENFDAIIPAPSSKARALQPVDAIAQALGAQRGVPVLVGYLNKEGDAELKGIDDPVERDNALKNGIKISGKEIIAGKNVLLVDDLYRSGATLSACCNLLIKNANVNEIYVLTMTKTRSKR
jgi:predicted amidophosphoribosyltransferase